MDQFIEKGCIFFDNKYCRTESSLYGDVVNKFESLYSKGTTKTIKGIVVSSGMQAIYHVLEQILRNHQTERKNIHILYSNNLYSRTNKTIKYLKQKNQQINVNCFDIETPQLLTNLFQEIGKNSYVVLFIESVSNPKGLIFDFSLIQKYRTLAKKLYVVLDNSWMSGILFNPFLYDVDAVVNSTSKFYSNGKHIGGVILSTNVDLISAIKNEIRMKGLHVSPFNLLQIKSTWDSLQDRIHASSLKTKELFETLKLKFKILYPFGSQLYKKYINQDYGPCLILFKIDFGSLEARKILSNQSLIKYSCSYGTSYSKINTFVIRDHNDNSKSWLRLYVGYEENVETLYQKIIQLFD
ncbi:homocysteine/cysteine synthase [Anaeramoeba flamelloides]|uniref:Homocysteine/cysteine synthase n=1 Tax=Anaeramoeba flamelloides TaxID=1746091 RepID=A0ABQ8X1Y0_9EUKA|nr:homocysteine/cysteine synthase [Anaeramoeba flamelloides]